MCFTEDLPKLNDELTFESSCKEEAKLELGATCRVECAEGTKASGSQEYVCNKVGKWEEQPEDLLCESAASGKFKLLQAAGSRKTKNTSNLINQKNIWSLESFVSAVLT